MMACLAHLLLLLDRNTGRYHTCASAGRPLDIPEPFLTSLASWASVVARLRGTKMISDVALIRVGPAIPKVELPSEQGQSDRIDEHGGASGLSHDHANDLARTEWSLVDTTPYPSMSSVCP